MLNTNFAKFDENLDAALERIDARQKQPANVATVVQHTAEEIALAKLQRFAANERRDEIRAETLEAKGAPGYTWTPSTSESAEDGRKRVKQEIKRIEKHASRNGLDPHDYPGYDDLLSERELLFTVIKPTKRELALARKKSTPESEKKRILKKQEVYEAAKNAYKNHMRSLNSELAERKQEVRKMAASEGISKDKWPTWIELDPECQRLEKAKEMLKQSFVSAIYKPVLDANWGLDYDFIKIKSLITGNARTGKAGYINMFQGAYIFVPEKGQEYMSPAEILTNDILNSYHSFAIPVFEPTLNTRKKNADPNNPEDMIDKCIGYHFFKKVTRDNTTIPYGVVQMVAGFIGDLYSFGSVKRGSILMKDKFGYTEKVSEFISWVNMDIAEHHGWVTSRSYVYLNAEWYGYNRVGTSTQLSLDMQSMMPKELRRMAYEYTNKCIEEAIKDITTTSDWANRNPLIAQHINEYAKAYRKYTKIYYLLANKHGTLKVHDTKILPLKEMEEENVSVDILKALALQVQAWFIDIFGKDAVGYANFMDDVMDLVFRFAPDIIIDMVAREECGRGRTTKAHWSEDDLMSQMSDALALTDDSTSMIVPQEEDPDSLAVTIHIETHDEAATRNKKAAKAAEASKAIQSLM